MLSEDRMLTPLGNMIGWVMLDYRSQTQRLRQLEERGITRRSGRGATELR